MNDKDLFAKEMSGVKPLDREPRVRPANGRIPQDQMRIRRRSAEGREDPISNPLIENGAPPLDARHVMEFKRPGIQHGVFRKLRSGKYEINGRLDLHGMTIAQAREEVFSFVQESIALGLRAVSIIHGKGRTGAQADNTAVLKGYVDRWLRQLKEVLAFHSAQPSHGGTGTIYVLLKKSTEKKRENRLKYTKGRLLD